MLPHILAEKRWQQLLLLAATGLLQSGCMLLLIRWARDFAEGGLPVDLSLAVMIFATVLFLAGGRYIERYKAEQMAQSYIFRLRQMVFCKAQQLPVEDLKVAGKGGTLLRLTGDMSAIRNWIVQGLAPLVVIGLWSTVALVALYQMNTLLFLAVSVPLLLALLGNYLLGQRLFRTSERLRRRRGLMIRNVNEKLRHLHLVRAFNQTGKEARLFNKQAKKLQRSQLRRSHVSAVMRGMNEALLLLAVLSLVSSALWLNRQGQLSGEYMAVLMTAALYLLGQLRRLTRLYEFWTLNRVAVKKLSQFIARQSLQQGRRKTLRSPFQLELRRVRCKGRLRSQSYSIHENSRILLSGPSGSGKSTLLAVLSGQTPIDGGRILLGGRKISAYHSSVVSRQICLVSGCLPLLRGTLEDNLFYGARHQSESYISAVLELCHLSDQQELPKGLNTRITEDGLNLSASLRYRVMLARALLRQPALLLLDEDSALQSRDVQQIIHNLAGFYRGAMVICGQETDFGDICSQPWILTGGFEHQKKRVKSNVIALGHYAKGE